MINLGRLHYINTLKSELDSTQAYKQISEEEKSIVIKHGNDAASKFAIHVPEKTK